MADATYTELNIGQIRPTPKGTWSATQAYNYLDIVKDTTASYIAVFLTGVPAGISTTNTTYWQPLAEDGKDANEFPFATETVKGVVELATPVEVLAGEDAERVVTPAGFKAALAASFIERAVTPASFKAASASTPCYYSRSAPFAPTKTTIVTPVRLWVNIALDGYIKEASETLNLNDEASWDSISPDYRVASARAGKDFYIYACAQLDGTFKYLLSANSTVPTGYTADNSRKIGGFHCLCVSVGTISGHTLSGYVTGDILPASVWDLAHRPASEPEGMVYVSGLNLWVDIYLSSFSDGKLKSVYGGVTANGASATKFHGYRFDEYFGLIKKKSLWQYEFEVASQGSNQLTNIAGSADPTTTGGHVDTASRRMISNYGLEDCCGFLYQWCRDSAEFTPGGTWPSPNRFLAGYDFKDIVYDSTIETSQGQTYGIPRRVLVGGHWGDGVRCGSRYSNWSNVPSFLLSNFGCRGASEPQKGE